jgi:hypothetical protein
MTCKNYRLWQQQIPALALGLAYEKDASTFTSSLFNFVATGLRTIQFLFLREEGWILQATIHTLLAAGLLGLPLSRGRK